MIQVAASNRRGDGGRRYAIFRCNCGKKIELPIGRVKSGLRTHCGCMANTKPNLKHGMRYTPEYQAWVAMKERCLNPKGKDYARWVGRGVTVYQEWAASFEAFYDHIGPRPDHTSLDRINNLGGYEPGNVRWATRQQQQRNRPGTHQWNIKGLSFETAAEAAAHFHVSSHSICRWVYGQHDRRRNSFTPPREDCHVVSRY